MIKKILKLIGIMGFVIALYCGINANIIKYPKQPQTFLENKSYQYAKNNRGNLGGICYQYANRMKKLFPEVKKEHIIISRIKNHIFAHYRIILFENDNLTIYTDSNQMGNQMIRTWYEFN